MAQTFTRMDESTAEQWAVIGKETFEHQERVAERVLELLRSLAAITDARQTRVPLWRGEPENIIGVLNITHLAHAILEILDSAPPGLT